jgi:hypothetical protein
MGKAAFDGGSAKVVLSKSFAHLGREVYSRLHVVPAHLICPTYPTAWRSRFQKTLELV